jgi:hypothetical protein
MMHADLPDWHGFCGAFASARDLNYCPEKVPVNTLQVVKVFIRLVIKSMRAM